MTVPKEMLDFEAIRLEWHRSKYPLNGALNISSTLQVLAAVPTLIAEIERLRALSEPAREPVREAAQALVEALDRCDDAIGGMFAFAHAHGHRYNGSTYAVELTALRAALAAREEIA